VLVITMAVLRTIGASSSSGRLSDISPHDTRRVPAPPITTPQPSVGALQLRAIDLARGLKADADAKKAKADPERLESLEGASDHAERLALEIAHEDCAAARARVQDLRALYVGDALRSDTYGRIKAQVVENAVDAYCTARARSPETP
jgi:hypothetical protein